MIIIDQFSYIEYCKFIHMIKTCMHTIFIRTSGANVAGRMRSPCNAIDASSVIAQAGDWSTWYSYIKYYYLTF